MDTDYDSGSPSQPEAGMRVGAFPDRTAELGGDAPWKLIIEAGNGEADHEHLN